MFLNNRPTWGNKGEVTRDYEIRAKTGQGPVTETVPAHSWAEAVRIFRGRYPDMQLIKCIAKKVG